MQALFEYLQAQIEDHIDHPRDDLTTFLLNAEMDGQPIEMGHVGGTIALLLLAGIDTTWSAIGASLWHLADHPDDRERLVAEPELLPIAMEELLRAYAPVTMARLVKKDMDWNGCPMKADDWVLLPFPAGNRDPEAFEDADKVIIDREENRHAAFGLGIHRCAGSHLARMELRVALEVWLEAFPSFELADPDAVLWSGGQVRGPGSCRSASADRPRGCDNMGAMSQVASPFSPFVGADRTDHRDRRRDPADARGGRDPAAAPGARLRDRRPVAAARRPSSECADAGHAAGRARRGAAGGGRELALEALMRFRDNGSQPAPPPSDEDVLKIMEFAVGGDDMAAYLPLLEEELAILGEDRRAPDWQPTTTTSVSPSSGRACRGSWSRTGCSRRASRS